MEHLDTILSIAASLVSIYAAVTAKSAHTKIAVLEQKLSSQVSGGQTVQGHGNRQIGGNVGGNVG